MKRIPLAILSILCFTLFIASTGAALGRLPPDAVPAATIRYVATGGGDAGNDCTATTTPCRTVQHAVDEAVEGDEIRIAAGIYTGVDSRSGVSQTVYLSKTLTLTGGFIPSDWTAPDPVAHPTVLDAQGDGRVFYITDNDSVVQGLRMTGGDASGLGGYYGTDAGGGVFVDGGAPTIRNCIIITNTASESSVGEGGGVFLSDSRAVISHSRILSNTGSSHYTGWGGGVNAFGGEPTVSHNLIQGNAASGASYGYGGGVYLGFTAAALSHNRIVDNRSDSANGGKGGGVFFHVSTSDIEGDIIYGNSARWGGGISLYGSDAATRNELVNTVIAGNEAALAGSGVYAEGVALQLLHVTISSNVGGDGSGIHAATFAWGDKRYPTTVESVNALVVEQTVGITVTQGSTATLNTTLWHNNTADNAGPGVVVHANDLAGSPSFAADGYHIMGRSAARDAGVFAGVTRDIDGERRPMHSAVDIGADEFPASNLFLPLLNKAAS